MPEPTPSPVQVPARRTPAWRQLALAAVLFLLALALLGLVRERGFEDRLNSDEPEWIAISILHWRQLVVGEPPAGIELADPATLSPNPWKQGVQHTTFGYMNPALPKVIWGGVLWAAGHREASPLAFQAFHRSRPEEGRAAQEALLPAMGVSRRLLLCLGALSAALLFLAARESCGGWPGWIAAAGAWAFWFASPLVRETASYLRTDYFMLPFVLGGLLLALRGRDALAGRRGRGPLLLTAAGLGVLTGLAAASKLNGALLGIATAVWIPLAWWRGRGESGLAFLRGPLPALLLAGSAAFLVFLLLNPLLWHGPIEGVRDILARWARLMGFFQDEWAPRTGVEVARTLGERASMYVRRTLERDQPLAPWLGLCVLLAGGAALGLQARLPRAASLARRAEGDAAAIVLVFVAVFAGGTLAWLPLDWPRLYLPAAPALALLTGAAVAVPLRALAGGLRRRAA